MATRKTVSPLVKLLALPADQINSIVNSERELAALAEWLVTMLSSLVSNPWCGDHRVPLLFRAARTTLGAASSLIYVPPPKKARKSKKTKKATTQRRI